MTYTKWITVWKAGDTRARQRLLQDTDEGKCGDQIRHTLFGIGDLETMRPEDIKDAVKNVAFMARLEG